MVEKYLKKVGKRKGRESYETQKNCLGHIRNFLP